MGYYCICGAVCFQEILIILHVFPARYHFSNLSTSKGIEREKFLLHVESWSSLSMVRITLGDQRMFVVKLMN